MKMKTIDANGLILGRMATQVAKLALTGETIQIINCEKAVISGNKKTLLKKVQHLRDMGGPFKGPFYPSKSDVIVKRAIRGMLPYKQERGRLALSRIKCYIGQPEELKIENMESFPKASKEKIQSTKTIPIAKISK